MKCNISPCLSLQSTEWKCSKCNLLFCTLICLSKHISTTHTAITKESSFLSKGIFLNNQISSDPYYNFTNFEFVFTSNRQLKCIGSGAFGNLYLARNKLDNKHFAIKQVNKDKVIETGAPLSIIKREIGYHIKLIHPGIVRLFSQYEDSKNFYMIMEFIPKGTLFQEIQKNKGLSEEKTFKYFIQVASAIHFLHQNGLAHRDIKPENILIDNDGNAKLCDFGWCVDVSKGERSTFCGTYEYMAPEIVNDQMYDYSTDIWSLGVLLYEMIHSYSPFRAKLNNDAMTDIFKNIKERKYTIDKPISLECSEIIDKLLTSDTKQRIKVNEIFEASWVKKREPKPIKILNSSFNTNKTTELNKPIDRVLIRKEIKPIEETIPNLKEVQELKTTSNNNAHLSSFSLNQEKETKSNIENTTPSSLIIEDNIQIFQNNTQLSSSLMKKEEKLHINNHYQSSSTQNQVKESKIQFQKPQNESRKNKNEFDDIISKVHKANESKEYSFKSKKIVKQIKKEKKKENAKLFNLLTSNPNNKNNRLLLESNDQANTSLNFNLNKSIVNLGQLNKTGLPTSKKLNIDDLDISESEEFAFLKDIKNYHPSKKTYDPSKV